MLATLVIGLREGLEAALIVGIIAAFLRTNGKSLRPVWLGVTLAVVLSAGVGVGLDLVERSLPQAGQEGMEAVIGAVAVFFVTTMIVWMNTHARGMRRELETEAAAALGQGSTYALAAMAFLAVLKEGVETSVFLLATFSAAQSAGLAATGAAVGVLIAVGIGWGIYAGGVKLNLSRFFQVTGAFLILVAAGLTITVLRTAHEAGWLNSGQQTTVNLSGLVAPGTVQSALITGVLGIPADPRTVEVAGWFAYLVPVALFVYWPRSLRLRGRAVVRLQAAGAAALAVTAVVLAVALPHPRADLSRPATLAATADPSAPAIGTARLTTGSRGTALRLAVTGSPETSIPLPAGRVRREPHDGVEASVWTVTDSSTPAAAASMVSLAEVAALSGGRLPLGLNPQQHPGPFTAHWAIHRSTTVWAGDGMLLDATQRTSEVLTVSGSGLQSPRSLSVDDPDVAGAHGWLVSAGYRDQAAAAVDRVTAARSQRSWWAVDVPIALAVIALFVGAAAVRGWVRLRRTPVSSVASLSTHRPAVAPADLP